MDNFSTNRNGPNDSITHGTGVLSYTEYPEYHAGLIIFKIVPPCLLLLGGFGNIATIFVMRRIKDHNSSQHVILMALAVSDLSFLSTAIPEKWILYTFNIDIAILNTVICKCSYFFLYGSGATSAWLVVCVTVQRTMAVLMPLRMQVMCTVRRTWFVIAAVVLLTATLYVHLLIGTDIDKENVCDVIEGMYAEFFYLVFNWIDLCFASLFPSVCLIVCNATLSVSLFQAVSLSSTLSHNKSNKAIAHATDSRRQMSYRTTVMVLAISCTFLLLTLPVCVHVLWSNYSLSVISENPQAEALDYLLNAVTGQLWYANSAINFFLYCLTGAKFRKEFMSWITCGAASSSTPSGH